MPPRRRPPAPGASSAAASTSKPTGARPSKLAKENNLTAEEEAEIREAFSLFSEPLEGEKEGIIPIGDVRRALIALGIPPTTPTQLTQFTTALDPSDEGFTTYPPFLAICALQLHDRRHASASASGEAHQAELDEAYALFSAAGDPDAAAITLADLKRVAALLRLDQPSSSGDGGGGKGGNRKGGEVVVTEEVLRDMILEANGGSGVGRGVRKGEFDGVMRRAGVWR